MSMTIKQSTGASQKIRMKEKDIAYFNLIHLKLIEEGKKIICKADAISYLIQLGKEKLNIPTE
jgi:hypothetical protein